MDEFKKLNVIFGLGLVGIAVALVGTGVEWKKKGDVAELEAKQVQALPADTSVAPPVDPASPAVSP